MDNESLTLTIEELPEGYFKERLTDICVSQNVQVNVVVSKGYVNDFAAYIGFPGTIEELKLEYRQEYAWYTRTVHTPEQVKAVGDKLSEKEARALFPHLKDLNYRR